MSASAVLAALAAGAGSILRPSASAAVDLETPISWPVSASTAPAGPGGRLGSDDIQVGTRLVARSFAAGGDPNGAAPDRSAAAGAPTLLRRVASIGAPIDRSSLPTFAPVRSADAAPRSVGGARIVQTSRADDPAQVPSPEASSSPTAPAAGRDDIEVFEAFGFAGSVQRAADGAAPARPERALDAASPVVSREDAGGAPGGAAAGAPGTGGDDKELDELARKLFPRMQLRLRNELLIDRERIGTLADLGR